jgi:LysM repeat protein
MKYRLTAFIACLLLAPLMALTQVGGTKMTREEYIRKYKDLAIKQMKESGIPASIILAQGCLESGNGNSRLSVEANNHFGIKCHQSWEGERIFHDDDEKQECFRKYPSPEGSYSDHSDFLRYRDRYKFLFDLNPKDYKAWAHGLKKAGYATLPEYADRLIAIIEENKLYVYDSGVEVEVPAPSVIEAPQRVETPFGKRPVINISRDRFVRNGVEYVLARTNDTYENIAVEYDIKLSKILSFNDAKTNAPLAKGQIVYIEPKKSKADKLQPVHIAEEGETLWQISQRFAVSLSALRKYNILPKTKEPVEGQEIYLRNKMKK